MRALTWQGTQKVSVETVPDPQIQEPTDAIVRMTSTAICGYEGVVRGGRVERNNLKTVNGDFGQLDRRSWRTLEPLLSAS